MKRNIAGVILVCLILFGMTVSSAFGASLNDTTTLSISLSDATIDLSKEKEVKIDVIFDQNPGVYAVNFALEYDKTAMQYVSSTDDHNCFGIISNPNNEKGYVLIKGLRDKDYDATGVITTLTFRLKENCKPGNYKISIVPPDEKKMVSCIDEKQVNCSLEGAVSDIVVFGTALEEEKQQESSGSLGSGSGILVAEKGTQQLEKCIVLTIDNSIAKVNDQKVILDAAPLIVNNRTYTPSRFVAEQLGASVAWDAAEQKVTVTSPKGTVIELTINSNVAKINGKNVEMDAAAFIKKGRTYTPSRFVAEQLGAAVEWDIDSRQVIINQFTEQEVIRK